MPIIWDEYQEAIYRHAATSQAHLVVDAKAGSGKTTTGVEMTRRIPKPRKVLVCAFNVKIRDVLSERVEKRITVRTFHQLGFHPVIKAFGPTLTVNRFRQRDIIRALLPHSDVVGPAAFGDVTKLVSMAMAKLAKTDAELDALIDDYGLQPVNATLRPAYVNWAQEVLWRSRDVQGEISFDDQVYLPGILGLKGAVYDNVVVDEAQDANPAQLQIVLNALRPGATLMAIGDERQAIYAFRGAGEDTMARIIQAFNARVLPLSITYRCPKKVVRLVNHIVPELRARPGAPEGIVETVSEGQFLNGVRAGDVVISRTNAAIAKYSMKLLLAGKRCAVLGKDISRGLVQLLARTTQPRTEAMLEELTAYAEEEAKRLIAAKKEDKAEELRDQVEAVRGFSSGMATRDDTRRRIESVFGDPEDVAYERTITFSTVHKAKGLEFERVWMFESTFRLDSTEGENLYYVAATRSMRELYLVQLPKRDGTLATSVSKKWSEE